MYVCVYPEDQISDVPDILGYVFRAHAHAREYEDLENQICYMFIDFSDSSLSYVF